MADDQPRHYTQKAVRFACRRCGARRRRGFKCCGLYAGMMHEKPVPPRNIHAHQDECDEQEVWDWLEDVANEDIVP